MTPDEEQTIRRLHAEFGSLEFRPPPVTAVTQRGKAIRGRRRALAGGCAAVVAVAVLVGRSLAGPGPAPDRVTLNAPNSRAPGGVFASGTADGKTWRLAVRNIAADPGTRWCLPAVMFNGGDGDVLFKTGPSVPSFGNPAFLRAIPGFPGVGAIFTQVASQVDRLVATFPGGRQLSVRPVRVSACGQRFYLAGFAFAHSSRGPDELSTYIKDGPAEALVLSSQGGKSVFGATDAGVWSNLDKSRVDIAESQATNPIGHGTVAGQIWHINASLGLHGQCYNAELRGAVGESNYGRGDSSECVPAAAPPRTIALSWVSVPGATMNLTGYAGLVSPRARELLASFDNGTTDTVHPVNVAGRSYVAFVVPPGCHVIQLSLRFADHSTAITALPPAR